MSQAGPTIPYAGAHQASTCPLCRERPTWKKTLYGHPVCRKCYYKFANRRQLAYIVDSVLFTLPLSAIFYFAAYQYAATTAQRGGTMPDDFVLEAFFAVLGLVFGCLFAMKDGFGGQSPGRRLTGVQVLDDRTNQPIGFGQSFKRNAILLVSNIPVVGGLAGLIVIVMIAVQLNKGYRIGDRYAQTRVIWKKYARSIVFGGDGLACQSCGYDLTGNQSGICPECGAAVPIPPLSPYVTPLQSPQAVY